MRVPLGKVRSESSATTEAAKSGGVRTVARTPVRVAAKGRGQRTPRPSRSRWETPRRFGRIAAGGAKRTAIFSVVSAMLCVLLVTLSAGCGRVSERVGRSAAKRAASVLGRDLARDTASRTVRLGREIRVFKYMTEGDKAVAQRFGFQPRTHFTPSAKPGRPLSGVAAQKRYGLPSRPDERLTVAIPKGTPVKPNKVIGGAPGYGELRIERPLPPESIVAGAKLKPGGR